MSAVQWMIAQRARGQSRYDSPCFDARPLANIYAPGTRFIVNDPMDVHMVQGCPSRVTCAYCGRTFDKAPKSSCPGCAGREFR